MSNQPLKTLLRLDAEKYFSNKYLLIDLKTFTPITFGNDLDILQELEREYNNPNIKLFSLNPHSDDRTMP